MASRIERQSVGDIETLKSKLDELLAANKATNTAINNVTAMLRDHAAESTTPTLVNDPFDPRQISIEILTLENFWPANRGPDPRMDQQPS